MRLKNYNEDLVLDTVKIVLKDRPDVKQTHSLVLDVAAYTLNRIPPKYITSERGFTRELISSVMDQDGMRLVNIIELIALINRAIEVVSGRRRRKVLKRKSVPTLTEAELAEVQLTYFYNLPHIFGRIVDSRSGTPVIAADATLFVNDTLSVPAEAGWDNPYRTNEQTKGYFSFWPQPEMGPGDSLHVDLSIGLAHEEYKPFTFKKSLKVPGEFFVNDYIRGDKILDIGTLTMEPG
jgi:competence protein ComFB